jgi:hypothetical protein
MATKKFGFALVIAPKKVLAQIVKPGETAPVTPGNEPTLSLLVEADSPMDAIEQFMATPMGKSKKVRRTCAMVQQITVENGENVWEKVQ